MNPQNKETNANKSIMSPYLITADISPLLIPLSINEAVIKGINTSINTSNEVKIGVKIVAFLYCPIQALNVFNIIFPPDSIVLIDDRDRYQTAPSLLLNTKNAFSFHSSASRLCFSDKSLPLFLSSNRFTIPAIVACET